MATRISDDDDDYWSDSGSEGGEEGHLTSVLLGVPDGALEDENDVLDVAVSRIGGLPAFLNSSEPPLSCAQCLNCGNVMELLVQMWCPFEDSPYDRALYAWGCRHGPCQKKTGSVRAWRGLRYNEAYAAKLAKKRARKEELERAKAKALEDDQQRKAAALKSNPFAVSAPGFPSIIIASVMISCTLTGQNAEFHLQMKSGDDTGFISNPFAGGLGSQLFGGATAPVPDHETTKKELAESVGRRDEDEEEDEDADVDDAASTSSAESLVTALANTSLASSPWASAPAYDALYLSTMQEYLPPSLLAKQATSPAANDDKADDIDEGDAQKSSGWALEAYESSHAVDAAFDRFSQRVSHQPEQCVRYDLRGAPLLFSAGPLLDALYPPPPDPAAGMVTRAAFVSTTAANTRRAYAPTEGTIKPCPACGSKRIFECQLVPNLINVLVKKDEKVTKGEKKETEEERKKAVERAIKGLDNDRGMEWGTCMIFSCDRDCCLEEKEKGGEAKGCWREEFVLVQWDE